MIEIRGLSFRYAGESRDALHNIDMTVEDGDFIGVTGPSGAGKTTLTQALSGLVPHRRAGDFFGSVTVNGVDTVDSSLTALALQVGSVFQDIDSQMVAGQVEDEILFGLENFGVDRAEIPRRIDEALGDVGIAPLRHRAIDSLSGGQKQKVAIAAILALRPKILVLDFAHRVLVLCEGALLLDGETRAVFRNEAVLRQASVLPPQITRLSLRLADCLPPADTAEEMEAAVRAARERRVPA